MDEKGIKNKHYINTQAHIITHVSRYSKRRSTTLADSKLQITRERKNDDCNDDAYSEDELRLPVVAVAGGVAAADPGEPSGGGLCGFLPQQRVRGPGVLPDPCLWAWSWSACLLWPLRCCGHVQVSDGRKEGRERERRQ